MIIFFFSFFFVFHSKCIYINRRISLPELNSKWIVKYHLINVMIQGKIIWKLSILVQSFSLLCRVFPFFCAFIKFILVQPFFPWEQIKWKNDPKRAYCNVFFYVSLQNRNKYIFNKPQDSFDHATHRVTLNRSNKLFDCVHNF